MPAQETNKLTALQVKNMKPGDKLGDGGGLWVRYPAKGSKFWYFEYTPPGGGNRRQHGLGSAKEGEVGLNDARRARDAAKELLRQGIDPQEHRKAAAAPKAEVPTFGKFADEFVKSIRSEFANAKHFAQWEMTLGDTYCKALRKVRIDQVNSGDVLQVLQPIWVTKSETASRLRGRIERVLDAAKAQNLRSGDNPAVWRGGLKAALPRRSKLTRGHHQALPFPDLPEFIEKLHERPAAAAPALEFLILTAARSGEVRLARWAEFDLKGAVWTVPAERMKAKREHRVPLTARMLEILVAVEEKKRKAGELVFPGAKEGRPMSDMTLGKLVARMGYKDVTVHGFRSTFRDWVGEATEFQREVAEAALAHTVGDATERAYRRGDALEKRRRLMEAWEAFCLGTGNSNAEEEQARATKDAA
ncbi:MAG: tyrosine-type recombinase/integrase [Devosia sp.]